MPQPCHAGQKAFAPSCIPLNLHSRRQQTFTFNDTNFSQACKKNFIFFFLQKSPPQQISLKSVEWLQRWNTRTDRNGLCYYTFTQRINVSCCSVDLRAPNRISREAQPPSASIYRPLHNPFIFQVISALLWLLGDHNQLYIYKRPVITTTLISDSQRSKRVWKGGSCPRHPPRNNEFT